MPGVFNARTLVHPHHYEPGLIITQSQASGYMDVLAGEGLRVQLGPIDKVVYANRLDVRTQIAANQATHNALPGATLTADFIQTATYTVRQRNEYNEFDVAEAGEYNVALPMAYRYAQRQGAFQFIRNAGLYGVNAANSEGLINTPGATTSNLPPDSFGNTTLRTYDAGQLAIWFNGVIQAGLSRMFLMGTPVRVVILGPQRILGTMQLQDIIQLTSYQRPGAGTATTAQTITTINKEFGYTVEWAFDDTLIGQGGSATTDAVLVVFPELNVPTMGGINTNEFAMVAPNISGNTLQYSDVIAPVEVTTPIPEGLDVTSTMRVSAGWCIRSQAITIAQIPY
jgi:hypothetical protein